MLAASKLLKVTGRPAEKEAAASIYASACRPAGSSVKLEQDIISINTGKLLLAAVCIPTSQQQVQARAHKI